MGAYQLAHERLKALALGPEESAALVAQANSTRELTIINYRS